MKSSERTRDGILTSLFGVICNLILSAGKIVSGILFGLVSVAADGINNLSDCGSGIVSLVSFFISEKPADQKHPFGHRRAEYIAAMVTGFLVLFLSVELLRESVAKAIRGEGSAGPWIVYPILGVSILAKAGMFFFYRIKAKRLSSDALHAAAMDSLCDCIATVAVIAGMTMQQFGIPADGWAGIAVSLFIAWQGIRILLEAGSKLLGQAPDPKLLEQIKTMILKTNGVLGLHDLQIFGYGYGASFATVHVEMDARFSALTSHAILDGLERRVREATGVSLTTHLDPVDLRDGEAENLKKKLAERIGEALEGAELHDFRMIRGVKIKVIFDVCVPYACKLKDEQIRRLLEAAVKDLGEYEPAITVERA